MAISLNLYRLGAVGFIVWLDFLSLKLSVTNEDKDNECCQKGDKLEAGTQMLPVIEVAIADGDDPTKHQAGAGRLEAQKRADKYRN